MREELHIVADQEQMESAYRASSRICQPLPGRRIFGLHLSRTFAPALNFEGLMCISSGYSVWSGTPTTNVMPQLGQWPALSER